MSWIKTASGRRIDYLNPQEDQIDIRDIATSLGRNHRFGGHSPLKIGQHINEVATLMMLELDEKRDGTITADMAEAGLIGLVHDHPEYAVQDVPTPLKCLIGELYDPIEDRLLQAMLRKWQLLGSWSRYNDLLKVADKDAVQQEAVRFKMDGYIMDDDGVEHNVPREWIPVDKVVTLTSAVWDEDIAREAVFCGFVKLMVLSGRLHLLPAFIQQQAKLSAEEEGMPITELVMQPIAPALLISGPSYF